MVRGKLLKTTRQAKTSTRGVVGRSGRVCVQELRELVDGRRAGEQEMRVVDTLHLHTAEHLRQVG